ncbi:hypothetical protein CC80DRAFT_398005 [Byssothecium circinans]|uniref:Uncharacterized protein n=1 Tax=Byssothecium circinans TaxID=147558 RepID=A0A6A5UDW3_9PLEO|nr:hypothetical protein CC80DRAFT_398005 [Byssothecium circinans]
MALTNRESSLELGDPSNITKYSKTTGRPIRRAAGKAKQIAGYVDSKVIEDDEDPIEVPSEDEDGEPIKPQRKRKRSPSLSPPPLDPLIRDEDPDEPSDVEAGLYQQNTAERAPITLQFNIPLGFHGPLMVKLDRKLLDQMQQGDRAHDLQPPRSKRRLAAKPKPVQRQQKKAGFTDLPPELRNKIYRHLFVTGDIVQIPRATNLCRSGQFLSTCKLVHSEGCSILYGENTIMLDRSRDRRGPYWEPVPKEIGYTDARRFLKAIGPENLAYLREVRLVMEDACPSATPYLNHEERRYVNDEHLIDILRILRNAKLREFKLTFLGRRALARTDIKILRYLEQVKADEVSSSSSGWYHPPKITFGLWADLKESMSRIPKLYAAKK